MVAVYDNYTNKTKKNPDYMCLDGFLAPVFAIFHKNCKSK